MGALNIGVTETHMNEGMPMAVPMSPQRHPFGLAPPTRQGPLPAY